MRRCFSRLGSLPAFGSALALLLGAAQAESDSGPRGIWNRDDGRGGIRIGACGDALCGDIAWLRDPNGPGHVGERVLFDMRRTTQNAWSGTARNPEDGRDYAGTMTLDGVRLITQGCAFGGLICKSVVLERAR